MNKKFFKGLGIYTAILTVLAVIALIIIWQVLVSYEMSRPEKVMDNFFESSSQDFWMEKFKNSLDPELSPFETEEDYFNALYNNFFVDAEFTYAPSSEYSEQIPSYTVRSNGTAIVTISLKPNPEDKLGFGMTGWTIDSIEAVNFMLEKSETVIITAPSTSTVTLNGITIGEDYISNANVPYDSLSDFELQDDYDTPYRVTYTVSGLYLQPQVVVEDAQLIISDGLTFDYCHENMGSYDVSITIPAGATAYVGGIAISQDLLTSGKTYPAFKNLGFTLTNEPCDLHLLLEDFVLAPAVKVLDYNGNPLSAESGVYISIESSDLKASCQTMVESFAENYINFATNISGNPTNAYYTMSPVLYPGSNLQIRLRESIYEMEWVYNVTNTIHEISAYDFIQYGENVAHCTLHIALTSRTNYENREIDDTYSLALVKDGGTWKIASMVKQ